MTTNCIDFVLPISPTDPNIPVDVADPILTSGSLLLVEPSNLTAFSDGGLSYNIAGDIASGIVSADVSVGATLSVSSGLQGQIEETAKGGLHVAISQTVEISSGSGVVAVYPQWLLDYLLDNLGHNYYWSIWRSGTRVVAAGSNAIQYGMIRNAGNGTYATAFAHDRVYPTTNNGSRTAGSNSLGPSLLNVGAVPQAGITAIGEPVGLRSLAGWGRILPFNTGAGDSLRLPSWVWYRSYVEDLTVSGRTYAEVDAADNALFTQQVLTAGGRFYEDTFTAPAALAP